MSSLHPIGDKDRFKVTESELILCYQKVIRAEILVAECRENMSMDVVGNRQKILDGIEQVKTLLGEAETTLKRNML